MFEEDPNIVALQETKCVEVPNELQSVYHSFLNPSEKSGHGGVLLLTKEQPITVVPHFTVIVEKKIFLCMVFEILFFFFLCTCCF